MRAVRAVIVGRFGGAVIIFAGIVNTLRSFGFEGAAGFGLGTALRIDAQRPARQVDKDYETQQVSKKGGVHTPSPNTRALGNRFLRLLLFNR